MATRTNLAQNAAEDVPQPYSALTEPYDDMHDDPRGPQSPLPLGSVDELISLFKTADGRARQSQTLYQASALGTAIFGATAVISAVLEIRSSESVSSAASEFPTLTAIEFSAAIAMLVCWVIMRRRKYEWLAQRHQAERYRQAKYKLLLHPENWINTAKVWSAPAWLSEELKEIAELQTKESLEGVIKNEPPHGPFEVKSRTLPRGALRQSVEYYLAKRLNPQIAYLANRVQGNEYKDFFFVLLAGLFSISVLAAAIHGLLHMKLYLFPRWAWKPAAWWRTLEIFALLAAAILPVMAATVRSLRAAFEFSRNKSRFSAARAALFDLEYRLVDAGFTSVPVSFPTASIPAPAVVEITHGSSSQPRIDSNSDADRIDAEKVLQELHWCEHILATEHIEWLRLMMETELFG